MRPAIFSPKRQGREAPAIPQTELPHANNIIKPPIYGYMRAYEDTPEAEIMKDELLLFRWAQLEGYDLAVIYQEEKEGSIAVLNEMLQQLKLTGDRAIVVPSVEHFGDSALLQEHLFAYVVHSADAEVHEAVDQ